MRRDALAGRFPVLCQHWPNFPPDTPGDEPPPHVRDLKLRRDVECLHRLPARVTFELLREIGASRNIQTPVETKAAAFASIAPNALAATGGDEFSPAPLTEVRP